MMKVLPINNIYEMDCFDFFKQIDDNSIDLVIADPPYYTTQWIKRKYWGEQVKELAGIKNIARFEAEWDKFNSEDEYQQFSDKWISECYRVLKPKGNIFIHSILSGEWTGLPNVVSSLKKNKFKMLNMINWCKPNGQPNLAGVRFAFCSEQILWACKETDEGKRTFNYKRLKILNNGKQMRDFWIIPTEPSQYEHPSPKPVKLIKIIIEAGSNENDLVLDCFMGTGTTAIASIMLNRNYIGCDNNPEYIKICQKRINGLPNTKLEQFI